MDWGDWLTWETAKSFGNSNFFTSLIGALAGAAGGALAAQRIADRAKVRSELLQEIRSTNAAIELGHGVCSTYLNLKEQHILGLRNTYEAQRLAVHAHDLGLRMGTIPPGTQLELGMIDFSTISAPPVRMDRLEEVVMSNLSFSGRLRPLVAVLAQSVATLNETIGERNAMVMALRAAAAPTHEKVPLIFGLPRNGMIDDRYGQLVSGLSKQIDECIYFSKFLCSELAEHGEAMRVAFKRSFRGETPRIAKLSWTEAEKRGLIPPRSDFETWHTNFVSRVPRTYGRRWAKAWCWWRRMFRRTVFGKLVRLVRRRLQRTKAAPKSGPR